MKTEPRTVDISKYWVPRVRETAEFQQIANALNPEFNMLIERQNRMLKDGFILEATEYGVERWEAILHLTVPDRMTLDERKQQILNKLSVEIPYTMPVLRQMLAAIVGEGNFTMSLDNDTQILDTQFKVISRSNVSAVQQLLKRVLPMNLDLHMLVDGVPPQYTTLEYLESSGTQYLLIDEPFKTGSGVYVDVHLTDSRLAQNSYYLYFYQLNFNSTYRIYAGLNGTARYIHNDEYGNYGSLLRAYSSDGRYSFGYNFRNSGQKILTTSAGTYTQAITAGYVKSSSKFPVFCIWRENEKTSAPQKCSQRVFSLQMTQGDVMTRDLVPVLNADGVPGMYDKVSKTFIANAGTGTFGYRIKTPVSDTMPLDLDDPYYTAPSGVWAKLIAENTLDIIADTDLAEGTTQGYTWFANSGDAYQYFNIEEVNEND